MAENTILNTNDPNSARFTNMSELEKEMTKLRNDSNLKDHQKNKLKAVAKANFHYQELRRMIEEIGYDFVGPIQARNTDESLSTIPNYLVTSKENIIKYKDTP